MPELKRLFGAYVEAKPAQNVLDYDDLLRAWAQVMQEPDFAAHIGATRDHVLIDEYQDTNRLQSRILLGLKPDGRGLTVVGDDPQSIYAFRAATVRNILDFPASFTPERNYRSTRPILAAANAVIEQARERFTKSLWTEPVSDEKPRLVTLLNEADQARHFVDQALENRERGMRLMSQAILFRTSSRSGQIEVDLTRRNVPFVKFGGLKFLDSAHVRDLLAVLRFAQNPRDRVAGFRVLQLVPMAAGKVLDASAAHTHRIEALATLPPPPRARHAQPVHPACDAGKLRGDPLVAAYSGRWQTQTRRPAKHRHCGQNAWHVDLTARSSSLGRTADAWSFN